MDNIEHLQAILLSMQQSLAALSGAIPEIQQRTVVTRLAWSNGIQTYSPMLTENQASHFENLQKQIIVLRKIAIQLDMQNGMNGRDVARTYNVTQSRVSQVCSAPVSWQPIDS